MTTSDGDTSRLPSPTTPPGLPAEPPGAPDGITAAAGWQPTRSGNGVPPRSPAREQENDLAGTTEDPTGNDTPAQMASEESADDTAGVPSAGTAPGMGADAEVGAASGADSPDDGRHVRDADLGPDDVADPGPTTAAAPPESPTPPSTPAALTPEAVTTPEPMATADSDPASEADPQLTSEPGPASSQDLPAVPEPLAEAPPFDLAATASPDEPSSPTSRGTATAPPGSAPPDASSTAAGPTDATSTDQAGTPEPDHVGPAPRILSRQTSQRYAPSNTRVRISFVALLVATLAATIDLPLVMAALPTIVGDVTAHAELPWIVTAPVLGTILAMPIFGKLGDLFGRKWTFLAALAIFAAGSALAGFWAESGPDFLTFRTIQAVGGGGLIATAPAIMADLVPARRRSRFFALLGAAWVVGFPLGPLVAGYLVERQSWQWCFYVTGGMATVALLIGLVTLKLPRGSRRRRFDMLGTLLFASATVCVILITAWGGTTYAWDSTVILGLAGGTVALVAMLVIIEKYAVEPVLPLTLFRDRSVTMASLLAVMAGLAVVGTLAYLPVVLQIVRAVTVWESGVLLAPFAGGVVATALIAGPVIARTGRYAVWGTLGTLVGAAGLGLLSFLGANSPYWRDSTALAVLGVGVGLLVPVLLLAAQSAAPARDVGAATALIAYAWQVGTCVGTAALGVLITYRLDSHPVAVQGGLTPPDGLPRPMGLAPHTLAFLPPHLRPDLAADLLQAVSPALLYGAPALGCGVVFAVLLRERLSTPGGTSWNGDPLQLQPLSSADEESPSGPTVVFWSPDPAVDAENVELASDVAQDDRGPGQGRPRPSIHGESAGAEGPGHDEMGLDAGGFEEADLDDGLDETGLDERGLDGRGLDEGRVHEDRPDPILGVAGAGHQHVDEQEFDEVDGDLRASAARAYHGMAGARSPYPTPAEEGLDSPELWSADVRIDVHVRQPDGRPIAGVVLTLCDLAGNEVARSTAAGDGRYELAAPEPGSYLLIASTDDYQPHAQVVDVYGRLAYVNVTLRAACGIHGEVRNAVGDPVAGAAVTLTNSLGEVVTSGTTGVHGSYALADLMPGNYTLTVSAAGYRPTAHVVHVPEATRVRHNVELVGGGQLHGTVRNMKGQPLPDAKITLLDSRGRVVRVTASGPSGHYRFDDVAEGTYTLVASMYPPAASGVYVASGQNHQHDVELSYPDL